MKSGDIANIIYALLIFIVHYFTQSLLLVVITILLLILFTLNKIMHKAP